MCISRTRTPRTVHFMEFTRLRAYIGFLPVRRTLPNSTHYALATLQHAGSVGPLVTQNVDGLHHAALRRILPQPEVDRHILELHGNIFVSRRFCSRSESPAATISFTFKISVFSCSPELRRRHPKSDHNTNRKCIVYMDTSTHAQRFKSGLARRIRDGARSLPSWSAQARNPRQIPTAMLL